MKKAVYQATLEFCNEILKKHGKAPREKLSPGKPGDSDSCAITNTLLDGSFRNDGINVSTFGDVEAVQVGNVDEDEDIDNRTTYDAPEAVHTFVSDFDKAPRSQEVDPWDLVEDK